MNHNEEPLTTNQQFVIMWLQTSLDGAWEGCQQNESATLDKNNMAAKQNKIVNIINKKNNTQKQQSGVR